MNTVYALMIYLSGHLVQPYMVFNTQDACMEAAKSMTDVIDLDGDDAISCKRWTVEIKDSGKDL